MENNKEMVNHPKHYNRGDIEAIEVIEDWNLYFSVGSAVKYIARLGAKDLELQELEKTRWYLERVNSNGIGSSVAVSKKFNPDMYIAKYTAMERKAKLRLQKLKPARATAISACGMAMQLSATIPDTHICNRPEAVKSSPSPT